MGKDVTRCSALCPIVYIQYYTRCSLWFSLGCCSVINCGCKFDVSNKLVQKLQNCENVDSRMCLFIVAGLS